MAEGTTVFLRPRGCAHANNSGCTHARTSTAMPYSSRQLRSTAHFCVLLCCSLDKSGQRHYFHVHRQQALRPDVPAAKATWERVHSSCIHLRLSRGAGRKNRRASNSVSAEVRASGTQVKRSSNRTPVELRALVRPERLDDAVPLEEATEAPTGSRRTSAPCVSQRRPRRAR